MDYVYFTLVSALAALIFAGILIRKIDKMDAGNERMQQIATYIRQGSLAFLKREYKTQAYFMILLFLLLTWKV